VHGASIGGGGGGGGGSPRKVVSFSAHNEWVEHWMDSAPQKPRSDPPTRLSSQQWARSAEELRLWLAHSRACAQSKFEARRAAAGLGSLRTVERERAQQTLLRLLLRPQPKQSPPQRRRRQLLQAWPLEHILQQLLRCSVQPRCTALGVKIAVRERQRALALVEGLCVTAPRRCVPVVYQHAGLELLLGLLPTGGPADSGEPQLKPGLGSLSAAAAVGSSAAAAAAAQDEAAPPTVSAGTWGGGNLGDMAGRRPPPPPPSHPMMMHAMPLGVAEAETLCSAVLDLLAVLIMLPSSEEDEAALDAAMTDGGDGLARIARLCGGGSGGGSQGAAHTGSAMLVLAAYMSAR
jgi:hypothetical protein